MASARGRCERDQISARFGAWATAVGAGPFVVGTVVCVLAVVLVVAAGGGEGAATSPLNWRAVVLSAARRGSELVATAATPRRRETYIV